MISYKVRLNIVFNTVHHIIYAIAAALCEIHSCCLVRACSHIYWLQHPLKSLSVIFIYTAMLGQTYIHCVKTPEGGRGLHLTIQLFCSEMHHPGTESLPELKYNKTQHCLQLRSILKIAVLAFLGDVGFCILSHRCAFFSAPHPQWLRIPHKLDADLAMEQAIS